MNRREAVKEILDSSTTAYVCNVAEEALKDGSDKALLHALVETKRAGMTLHVVNIANEQLGYESNDTR